jgi:hypothetical protein
VKTKEYYLMKKLLALLSIALLLTAPLYSSDQKVSEIDLSITLKSIILSCATGYTATLLTPPLQLERATFEKKNGLTSFYFDIEEGDVGKMRKQVLSFPQPEITPKGFFEMLFESVQSLLPSYLMMRDYLARQMVNEDEIYLTGEMSAQRIGDSYPFRYEGEGSFVAWGKRLEQPITIEFSFYIPLEGEQVGSIVPRSLQANGEDYIDSAMNIFHL